MLKLLPFIIARGLFAFLYWMIFAYLPIFLKSYGIKDAQIGLIIGSYSFAALSLMIPIGLFSDRLSSKNYFYFALLFSLSTFCHWTIAKTFLPILITVILGGFGAGGLIIILPTLFLKVCRQ
ncbi:MAG: Major Facilitator Superfamily protein [Candidatus Methanoperedenaceae archaeon GB50]|nr:MAG: Major Facilitator Superfamily protein [Candidatus Methanoperedenaceae archaeon GB50]